ncbi:bifunctional hydroxymethylpyrimidine kinase/phosphomethylpyrimidine kinase [Candidatus Microgenomates bacterium]|nr:bifunctional hydroxymethylpyrimidine kinase/phosphomethylpyrimidine kinase [Candidatus Microgenomates bacterium]
MARAKLAALGAVTFDAFLAGEAFRAKRDVRSYDYVEQFPVGEKIEVDKVVFGTGGGAANAAVTFARQGLESGFLGKVGDDLPGREILNTLKAEGVNTRLVACDLDSPTGYSTVLLTPGGERTVLVHRGASEDMQVADFDWTQLEGDWLYITSLGGNIELLKRAINEASKKQMKIALDAGSKELAAADHWRGLVPKLTLVKGNKEEMRQLFGPADVDDIIKKAAEHCQYVVVTNGPAGAWASDGQQLYRMGLYRDVEVIDRTGAGDAFGSGLVAGLARGQSLAEAMRLGSANATAVVQQIGSQAGIIRHPAKLSAVQIQTRPL